MAASSKLTNWSDGIRPLLLLPSTWGVATFVPTYLIFIAGFFGQEPILLETHVCVAAAVLLWTWSSLRSANAARAAIEEIASGRPARGISLPIVLLLHALGFVGWAKYWHDVVADAGQWAVVLGWIQDRAASEVRGLTEEVPTIGTQISYFGWAAVIGSVVLVKEVRSRKAKWVLIVCAILQFGTNLTFIDRTRPVWVLCTVLFTLLALNYRKVNVRTLAVLLPTLSVIVLVIFSAIGYAIGKVGAETDNVGQLMLANLAHINNYLVAGFGYINHVFLVEGGYNYFPARTFTLFVNVCHKLEMGCSAAPDQILDFYYVPYPTNVGTFWEPQYRDGGFAYVALVTLLYGPLLNGLATRLLKSGNFWGLYAWSNLCFVELMAFFSPRLISFSAYAVLAPGLVVLLMNWARSLTSRRMVQGDVRVNPHSQA